MMHLSREAILASRHHNESPEKFANLDCVIQIVLFTENRESQSEKRQKRAFKKDDFVNHRGKRRTIGKQFVVARAFGTADAVFCFVGPGGGTFRNRAFAAGPDSSVPPRTSQRPGRRNSPSVSPVSLTLPRADPPRPMPTPMASVRVISESVRIAPSLALVGDRSERRYNLPLRQARHSWHAWYGIPGEIGFLLATGYAEGNGDSDTEARQHRGGSRRVSRSAAHTVAQGVSP